MRSNEKTCICEKLTSLPFIQFYVRIPVRIISSISRDSSVLEIAMISIILLLDIRNFSSNVNRDCVRDTDYLQASAHTLSYRLGYFEFTHRNS